MPDILFEDIHTQSTFVVGSPVASPDITFEPIASFALDATGSLIGAIWITRAGQKVYNNLGVASFTFYDKAGAPVGISQAGLTPNANGDFLIAPVPNAPIVDLTHYTVQLEVVVDGDNKRGQVGVPVGE